MKLDTKTCIRLGITIFSIYLAIRFFPSVLSFGKTLLSALSSIIIGAIIAYLLNLLMSGYEKHYFPKKSGHKLVEKTRTPVCLLLAILTLLTALALILLLILPELTSCIKTLTALIPPFIAKALELADDISWIPQQLITALESIDWKSLISRVFSILPSGMSDIVSFLTGALASIFSTIVTAFFSIIFAIYLLTGKRRLKCGALRLARLYLPKAFRVRLLHLLAVLNDCFHRYIVGQCIEALILGALCTIGMLILNLPYATMIGALIAFTALIPIAGAYIGAGVGAFMILTVSPMKALIFLIFLLILQQLEGNLIYPHVVGTSLGLPGIWVLFAVTVGGGLAGVIGMLLGVPLVAAGYRLANEDMIHREALAHTAVVSHTAPKESEQSDTVAEDADSTDCES